MTESRSAVDRFIEGLDLALRAVAGVHRALRPSPAEDQKEGAKAFLEKRDASYKGR